MPVYRDDYKPDRWKVSMRYKDFSGKSRHTTKRGFKTKREAQAWERKEIDKRNGRLEMTFETFVECYKEDKGSRIKEATWQSKENIINTKIMPYFKDKRMCDIQPRDIIDWQNKMMSYTNEKGEKFAPSYLRTISTQLTAIFNHAVRLYNLPENPSSKVGNMGKSKHNEMNIWTDEEYKKFADVMMDYPKYYYVFEILYWCGLRVGEMLALTPSDFDFDKATVSITKTYHRFNGKDVITDPKTEKSNRVIVMPDFVCEEIKYYIDHLKGIKENDRIFPMTLSGVSYQLKRGAREAGLKKIRVHDLRHSHISLLIHLGYSAVAIGDRVGHESAEITYSYAHLFPTEQTDMANSLDLIRKEA